MILLIDNYDSFTYNLVQRLGEIDPSLDLQVYRNDKITLEEIDARRPTHIIISPGPCRPDEAGISIGCVKRFAGKMPLLGVCLGHQAIGQAFGGTIVRADRLMHGKVDQIHHDRCGLFEGLDNPFPATRYHSLVIRPDTLSEVFEVCAWSVSPDGSRVIMGIRHKQYPLYGLQFHPESFLTEVGTTLLARFLELRVQGSGFGGQDSSGVQGSGVRVQDSKSLSASALQSNTDLRTAPPHLPNADPEPRTPNPEP